MSDITEDSWILISVSAFYLLWHVLVEVYRNVVSYRYVVRKEIGILVSFSDNFEFSSSPKCH